MTDTSFKWTCITCDKDIPQHLEYCAECEEKRYRKIGGLLFLPLLSLALIAWEYFTSLRMALYAGLETMGHLQIAQSSYLYIAAGINFIFLLYTLYTVSLFLRKKKELPLAYSLLIIGGIVTMVIDRVATLYLFPQISLNFALIIPLVMYIIYACIWIPYFRYSVRVKKTFIW
ncbi:DUF2569 family protein [Atlantibacter hermannii]|nr:DUF2569 domain-containing protein [Atlantibacter hermannii]NBD00033.1 DUF2569 family protein [Atlantibacter hermannii]